MTKCPDFILSFNVTPAKAGVHRAASAWIPAFAGMTSEMKLLIWRLS